MKFQKIVVIIAIIILVASLTFIGYALYNSQHNEQFPPVKSACPDYWKSEEGKCVNSRSDLGLATCQKTMDFNGPHFQGHQGDCNKSIWAKSCNVSWSGITNNSNICK